MPECDPFTKREVNFPAPVTTDRIGKACADSNRDELTMRRKGASDADWVGHHSEMAWDTQPGQTSVNFMCI